jgi:hypothetical protein
MCIWAWAWAWETNNRLPAISKTTAYQIHDSILKATMARCLAMCGWRVGMVLLVGVH